jgi:phage-related protein
MLMDNKWKIKAYESTNGDQPIEKFIKSLDKKARLKVSRTLDLLEEFGLEGAYPHVKKLTGTSLWELRILGGDSIRILYITVAGRIFLLLHGFKKKKQKTPSRELKVAEERLREYHSRNITS